jgi:hypothetical protein
MAFCLVATSPFPAHANGKCFIKEATEVATTIKKRRK